jgi:serine/alanine racemase
MTRGEGFGGLDRFRLIAALLVVGIHTYPFASYNGDLDYYIIHVAARIAVPFFLMTTGYFLKPSAPSGTLIKKPLTLYALASALYLPVSVYAGYYSGGNVSAALIRNIFFDGMFYHLWYLPASVIGILLVVFLIRSLKISAVLGITGILYLLGLLGDSYYGVALKVPILNGIYDAMFGLFSYTRNGLFYAPVFIAMGYGMAKAKSRPGAAAGFVGFIASAAFMLMEGHILRLYMLQWHDSMYIALIPCMYFLFAFLLTRGGPACPTLRIVSMWVYIVHPLGIIAVRGAAKITGLTSMFVDDSLIHYAAVCLLSLAVSALIASFTPGGKARMYQKGRAWIELDMESLRHNVTVLRGLLPDSCRLMPAVKANAYGHGVVMICRELNALGVRSFCVATADEGAELRKHRVKGEILVLGYTYPEQLRLIRRYRLTQTVVDNEYAKALNAYGKRMNAHIKVDTGMRRLGEPAESIDGIIDIFKHKNLNISGIYSHLCADGESPGERAFTEEQIGRFNSCRSAIRERGFTCPPAHLQSSFGIFNHPELPYDWARPGIALYGMLSNAQDTFNAGLLPVLTLKARIGAVKPLRAGECAGYGLAFRAERNMEIAVLTVGYADGLPRNLSRDGGHVLINRRKAPIIGHVCMDQTIVDVTGIGNVRRGDAAVIIGQSGGEAITACDMAGWAGTIPNEILCRLGCRLERVL